MGSDPVFRPEIEEYMNGPSDDPSQNKPESCPLYEEDFGDGVILSTPFGSTAYFNHVTRGLFYRGLGIAFNHVAEHTTHLVLPEDTVIRVVVTRGPAILAYDSAPEYYDLCDGAELIASRADRPATILTWGPTSRHPSQVF